MMKSASLTVYILLLSLSVAFAQTDTATITGTITDSTGAVLPGADVTVTDESTAIGQTVITNDAGIYVVALLKPGTYRVAVTLPGFKTGVRRGLVLQVGDRLNADMSLQVGEVHEQVTLVAQAPLLEAETSSLGQVVDTTTIVTLPLNGRNYLQLGNLTAGTVPTTRSRDRSFSAYGNRGLQNTFLLDGVTNVSYIRGLDNRARDAIRPSLDALREFKVETGNSSAEFGRSAGAIVNAVIKSGTNEFHGTAFEFMRNSALDARPFFQPPGTKKPLFIQNQFGGTMGGPILKNRAFFFASYEGTRIRNASPVLATVPTQDLRNGTFRGVPLFDPLTTRPNPSGAGSVRDVFPNNVVPRQRWDPIAARLIDFFPPPNRPGLVNNFVRNPRAAEEVDRLDTRVDHKWSDKDSFFARFSLSQGRQDLVTTLPPPANVPIFRDVNTRGVALGQTHTLNPRTVNELRLGYTRVLVANKTTAAREDFGIRRVMDPKINGIPNFTISGLSGIGTFFNTPLEKSSEVYQLVDNLSWVRGAHTFKTGFDIQVIRLKTFATLAGRGSFTFNGVFTQDPQRRPGTGHPLADFLLGLPNNATTGTTVRNDERSRAFYFYLQDDWKVTSKLTLNLGIRYELLKPYFDKANRMANFILEPSDPAFGTLVFAGTPGRPRALLNLDKNNIAPRFGLAYRITPHTVIRSSFGIFYGQDEGQGISQRMTNNPPFFISIPVISDQINPATAVQLSQGFPEGVVDPARLRNPSVISWSPDFPLPYIQQWSLNVERELPGGVLVQVGYVGSAGVKLISTYNANQPEPGPGPIDPRRRFPRFGPINRSEPLVRSSYHGLSVRMEKRFAHGVSFLGGYTWGHVITTTDATDITDENVPIQNARNRRAERGNADHDIRHRLVFSSIWELPFGPRRRFLRGRPVLGGILGGWTVSGIAQIQGGLPLTPLLNIDTTNTGTTARPNRIRGGSLSRSQRTVQRFFDVDAFVFPAPFTFGNSGRNILRGPGLVNFDFALYRDFRITEALTLQFRGELFDLTNTPHFDVPGRTIGTPQAGVISSAGPPRQIQFGLKVIF